MSSAKFDITLEEHSNLTYVFTYKDKDGAAIDVTDYGARIVFAEKAGTEPLLDLDDVGGHITVGTTDGKFTLAVAYTNYSNLKDVKKGLWQLYIYPTRGTFSSGPKRLIGGEFTYSRSLILNV